jgi:predicted nucleotidyltransferase
MAVGPEQTARHLKRREEERARRGTERAARLRGRLPQAAALLEEKFGAQKVWVFGSLVTGEVTERSDADLATEGLSPSRYFEALAELMTLFGGPVDLVRLEEADESLRDRILTEGRTL